MKIPYRITSDGKIEQQIDFFKLATAMMQPLRRRLDYQGLARKVFIVEELPQGALPFYSNKDDK